jgi:hypothetical protein
MPTEACYLVSIENAILLCLVYGLLSSYFDDVMGFGFLFFAVFVGISLSYVSIVSGFCLLLFDETTNRQIILLNADNSPPQGARTLNRVAQLARVLARSGAVCTVAIFILFVTVCVEFFTEDTVSSSDSLVTITLKKAPTESFLTTQIAVSIALAVFFIILVMILSNSQQLTGILVRLEHMTQQTTQTSTSDDLALFVRTLLIAYVIAIDGAGTFRHLPQDSMVNDLPTVEITLLDGIRNRTSLLVITWVFILNVIETFLPVFVTIVFVKVLYVLQLFLSLVAIEILLHDITLTSMACVVLVACDAFLVLYTSVYHIYHEIRVQKWPNAQSGATNDASGDNEDVAATMPHVRSKTSLRDDMSDEFDVNHQKINIDSLNWRIFQKKSN